MIAGRQYWIIIWYLILALGLLGFWAGVFWGSAEELPPIQDSLTTSRLRLPRLMVASTGVLVAASIAFVIAAAPLYELGEVAAEALIDPAIYIDAVRSP